MTSKHIIAVTPGDPAGIGPEIVWKTLSSAAYPRFDAALLCIGARAPFARMGVRMIEVTLDELMRGAEPPAQPPGMPGGTPYVWLLPAPAEAPARVSRQKRFSLEGYQSGWSIEMATKLVQSKIADAVVTGPISKERLQAGGYRFPGHTEFLAKLCRTRQVTMMLANDDLRIALVTTHLALKDVSRSIRPAALSRAILQTHQSLANWWGVAKPKIAIAALNPHAGENGLFGKEELRVISPVIKRLQKKLGSKAVLVGPLPADTLFAQHIATPVQDRFDAVVCMYHDQGLIPVKLLDFPKTVNVTLGLPIVRTSVDHGVGFDIVGTGRADPSSLQSAIRLAVQITLNRRSDS